MVYKGCIFFVVQSLSCIQLFATPRTAAHQASLSLTISQSLPKFMSIESVMPSNHLILCHRTVSQTLAISWFFRIYLPMQETREMRVQSLGWEDPLEKEMATHSSIIAWKIPGTEEPGGLQFMGLQRVRHDWAHTWLSWQVSDYHVMVLNLYILD